MVDGSVSKTNKPAYRDDAAHHRFMNEDSTFASLEGAWIFAVGIVLACMTDWRSCRRLRKLVRAVLELTC